MVCSDHVGNGSLRAGDIGNTLAPKGLAMLVSRPISWSKSLQVVFQKGHERDVLADLLDSESLPSQHGGDVDALAIYADAGAHQDLPIPPRRGSCFATPSGPAWAESLAPQSPQSRGSTVTAQRTLAFEVPSLNGQRPRQCAGVGGIVPGALRLSPATWARPAIQVFAR